MTDYSSFKHPITHTEDIRTVSEIASKEPVYNQYYILPQDCENRDQIGKVNFLWSHQKFFNRRWGISIDDSSYTFEISAGNSGNAFSISTEGELTIDKASLFIATRYLTVRVKLFENYFEETICKVYRIPVKNCVYFDYEVNGKGEGTRKNPYKRWKDHFYGSAPAIATGKSGNFYLWKRGQRIEDWTKVQNPLIKGERPGYITLGAWGKGSRPIIDGSNNKNSERFCDVGDARLNGTSVTVATNPDGVAHNICIMDIETDFDGEGRWYPYQVGMYGKGNRFIRLKCSTVLEWEDGFFWVKNHPGAEGSGLLEALFQDIETYDSKYRAIKFEGGAIKGRNFRCYTSVIDSETPLSAANAPFVDLKYADLQCGDNKRSLGIQVRAEAHTYEWFYLKGYQDAMNPFRHVAHNGLDESFGIKNSGYQHILIDGCTRFICQSVNNGPTDKKPIGIYFKNIDVMNSSGASGGLTIAQDAADTLIEMCNLGDSPGIVVFPDTSSTVIRNCTVPGKIDRRAATTIINTVYGRLMGAGGGEIITSVSPLKPSYFVDMVGGNYRPAPGSPLIGAATELNQAHDLEGNEMRNFPTIGCYELAPDPDLEQ